MALKSPEGGGVASRLVARWRRSGRTDGNGAAAGAPEQRRFVLPGNPGTDSGSRGFLTGSTAPALRDAQTPEPRTFPVPWPGTTGADSAPDFPPDASGSDGYHQDTAGPQPDGDKDGEDTRQIIGPRALRATRLTGVRQDGSRVGEAKDGEERDVTAHPELKATERPDYRGHGKLLGDSVRGVVSGRTAHDAHHAALRNGGTVKGAYAVHVAGGRQTAAEHHDSAHDDGFAARNVRVAAQEEQERHGRPAKLDAYHQDTSHAPIGSVRETLMLGFLKLEEHPRSQAYLHVIQERWAQYMGEGMRPLSDHLDIFAESGDTGGLLLGSHEPFGDKVKRYIAQEAGKIASYWNLHASKEPKHFTGRDPSGDPDDRQVNRLGQGRAVTNVMRHIEDLDKRYVTHRARDGQPYQGSPHTFDRRIRLAAVLQSGGDHAMTQANAMRAEAARLGEWRAGRKADLLRRAKVADAVGINAQKNADQIVREAFAKELAAKQRELHALSDPAFAKKAEERRALQEDIAVLTPIVHALAD